MTRLQVVATIGAGEKKIKKLSQEGHEHMCLYTDSVNAPLRSEVHWLLQLIHDQICRGGYRKSASSVEAYHI